jgi:DNA polymerase-3 subunit delta'
VGGKPQWLKADTHLPYVHITTDEDNSNKMPRSNWEKFDLAAFVQQTVDGWRVIIIEPAEAATQLQPRFIENAEEPGDVLLLSFFYCDHYLKLLCKRP